MAVAKVGAALCCLQWHGEYGGRRTVSGRSATGGQGAGTAARHSAAESTLAPLSARGRFPGYTHVLREYVYSLGQGCSGIDSILLCLLPNQLAALRRDAGGNCRNEQVAQHYQHGFLHVDVQMMTSRSCTASLRPRAGPACCTTAARRCGLPARGPRGVV